MLEFIKKKIAWLILHYNLITCMNMFEPWEQVCLNATVFLVISLVSYSSYVYLPHYIMSLFNGVWNIILSGEERIEYRFDNFPSVQYLILLSCHLPGNIKRKLRILLSFRTIRLHWNSKLIDFSSVILNVKRGAGYLVFFKAQTK